jgi:hypothetical protein
MGRGDFNPLLVSARSETTDQDDKNERASPHHMHTQGDNQGLDV